MMKEGKQESMAKKVDMNLPLQVNLQTSIGRWKPTRKDAWPYSAKNILPKNQAILRDLFDACPDTGEVKGVGNKIFG